MTEVFQSMRTLSKTIQRNILQIYKEMEKDQNKVDAANALRLNLDVLLKEFRVSKKAQREAKRIKKAEKIGNNDEAKDSNDG